MRNLFLKQLTSVRTNNLVIGVIMDKYKMSGIQVRRAFTKSDRRKRAKLLLNVNGSCL